MNFLTNAGIDSSNITTILIQGSDSDDMLYTGTVTISNAELSSLSTSQQNELISTLTSYYATELSVDPDTIVITLRSGSIIADVYIYQTAEQAQTSPTIFSVKSDWNLIGATKSGDVTDAGNIITSMVSYSNESKSYVVVPLTTGKRTVVEGKGYFVNCSQDGTLTL